MSNQTHHFFEFEGIRFYPEQRRLVTVRGGRSYTIRPKERDLLVALIKKARQTVTYEELRQEVWPEFGRVQDIMQNTRETKRTLGKLLNDISKTSDNIIETVTGKGYRLNAEVTESSNDNVEIIQNDTTDLADGLAEAKSTHQESSETERQEKVEERFQPITSPSLDSLLNRVKGPDRLARPFGGQLWHVVVSCTLYALLYAVALLLEVAYQFDRFGSTALRIAPLLFLWVFGTSMAGLRADWKGTQQDQANGLVLSLSIFIFASLMLYAALGWFLPGVPITEANFQAYSAHGAYLKDTTYFLPLAIVFLILPFHFVVSMQRELQAGRHHLVLALLRGEGSSGTPKGDIYLRVWALGLILSGAAIASLVMTAHLLDNLKPNAYMNLFIQLVQWRRLLYFALGLECLIWYYRSLNEIKRECLEPQPKA